MKKLIIYTILIYLFTSNISFSQWVSFSNGITESDNYYLLNVNNKLYAANSFGLYFSTNEGIKWQNYSLSANLNVLLIKDTFLYAGGYDGLFLSTNDGSNWTKVINSNTSSIVTSGTQLFASVQNNGILKSTNNGFNWTNVYASSWRSVTSLAVKDNFIFAGLGSGEYSTGEVIFSTNGGNNWSSTNLDSVSVTTLCVKNQYLFAGTYSNGLYRSADNGNSWINLSILNYPVKLIKYIDNILYVSCGIGSSEYNRFYQSANNGDVWQLINTPYGNRLAVSVEKTNNTFVTALSGGIFLSYDNSPGWIHYLHMNATISTLYNHGTRLFAGVNNQGIYYSDDNGANWVQTNLRKLMPLEFTSKSDTLFVGTYFYTVSSDTGGVFISTDNGINWNFTNLRAKTINALRNIDSKLYAGAAYYGIYTSTNSGNNWVRISNFPAAVPYCFYKRNSKIFVGSFKESYRISGLFFTTNEGVSWDSIVGTKSINRIVANSNFLFGSSNDSSGPIRSSNEGLTWTTTTLNKGTWDIIVNNNFVFAGTTMNGVYMSSDNGTTWRAKNEGLLDNNIHGLLIYNGYIFAGSYSKGIYRRTLQDITSINNNSSNIPDKFSLSQNYPNPFNPSTKISYKVESYKFIRLVVYDILGKEVAVLVNEKLQPGTYETQFPNNSGVTNNQLPSGVYFYSLFADGNLIETKKMVLLK